MSTFLATLPDTLLARLDGPARRFERRWQFIGCAGFAITPDVVRSVTLYGALMTIAHPRALDHVATVLVYPEPFLVDRFHDHGGFVTHEEGAVLTGEASVSGTIVLSWDDLMHDEPGYNVAIHELAHQLDWQNGAITGTPVLDGDHAYEQWKQVFDGAFQQLKTEEYAGIDGPLDPYALENEGEFFAVAAETFFTDGMTLKGWNAPMYALLARYFGISL